MSPYSAISTALALSSPRSLTTMEQNTDNESFLIENTFLSELLPSTAVNPQFCTAPPRAIAFKLVQW